MKSQRVTNGGSQENRAAPEIGAAVYERSIAELAAEMAAGRPSA